MYALEHKVSSIFTRTLRMMFSLSFVGGSKYRGVQIRWDTGTRRSSGGYSVVNRPVYFTAFNWSNSNKKRKQKVVINVLLDYSPYLDGFFRWDSKKNVTISVICLFDSFIH